MKRIKIRAVITYTIDPDAYSNLKDEREMIRGRLEGYLMTKVEVKVARVDR